ncbi:type IV secretion system protein VirB3 [Pseudochrobactrum sp. MP213Fo]|uniref:type IV secretion system protein VirB3 n=1 Tax=Pseudochrobactrum sp. MP213Fo TaxID=3022250 RepID=UPI003BA0588A
MSLYQDEKPCLTPLVIGLTRSPTLWGVPYMALVLVIGFTLIFWLAVASLWTLIIAPFGYFILFGLCAWDNKILDVIQVAFSKTPSVPNKSAWGCNSYGA